MRVRWTLVAMAIPTLVAVVALYLAVENVARAGPGSGIFIPAPEVPSVVSYQGLITDPDTGDPVIDGIYNMHFAIYDAPANGVHMWEEPLAPAVIPVQVSGGVFTVLLGSITPLTPDVFAGGDAYLEVDLNGETLAPRQMMASVPYAMVAETLLGYTLADLDNRYVRNDGSFLSPAYDSGFVAIAPGAVDAFAHNVGGNPDAYFVDLRCQDPTGFLAPGINNIGIGQDDDGGAVNGAYWLWLGDTNIFVFRAADDASCEEVQVRIWEIK